MYIYIYISVVSSCGLQPIWVNLAKNGLELRRDIRRVYYGESAALEVILGVRGPFWGRHYVFWQGGRPLTVILEVFSPTLGIYLGDLVEGARAMDRG